MSSTLESERAPHLAKDKEREARPHRGAPRKKAKVIPKHELPRGFPPDHHLHKPPSKCA